MNLPPDITAAVIKATAIELADRVSPALEELQLVSLKTACEILGVGKTKARSLIAEYVELGEKSPRVSVATLRRLIADRTIPA